MQVAGAKSLYDIEQLAVMGLVEPLLHLPQLIKMRQGLYKHFAKHQPDVFIGIDAPDFNLGLEYKLKQHGIPIIHYVSPSVWAWRQKRIHKIAKAVDLMLTLFPFETKFYQAHGVPVEYVGHPLAEQIPLQPQRDEARRALCIDRDAYYIALLPGSRKQEIRYLAEAFLLAAQRIHAIYPEVKFLTSHINEDRYQEFYSIYQRVAPDLPLQFFTRRSQDVMTACNVAMVTSGTATLETMLYKRPMVIAYKMSALAFPLAKLLVKTPYIGLPNLLANELIVPELIQHQVRPDLIAAEVIRFIENPQLVTAIEKKFTQLHQQLLVHNDGKIIQAIQKVIKHK